MAVHLDENERGFLRAFEQVDPEREAWVAPWAPDLTKAAKAHGADAVATSFEGSQSVCRRLTSRKLLEGEPGVRGAQRGYSISDKGKAALA